MPTLSVPSMSVPPAPDFIAPLLTPDQRKVLHAVLWMDHPSRLHLCEALDFSKSKLTSLVGTLLDEALIEEGEMQPSGGGRRALGLRLSRALGVVVGIDLGATHAQVSLSDLTTRQLCSAHVMVEVGRGPGPVLAKIVPLIDDLLAQQGLSRAHVLGLGMGVPGPVEFETGLLISPPLMPNWEGFNLRAYFADLFAAPLAVDNDVNLMALGELHHARRQALGAAHTPRAVQGRWPGQENLLVVKLGTGIGAGIIMRGEVFRGADGAAGDIGHISVDAYGPRCSCGNVGCLEALAGAPNIVREARAAAEGGQSPLLAALLEADPAAFSTREVALAARQGDPVANDILQLAGTRVGQVIAGLINFMNPSQVLLSGGVAQVGPLLLASVRQSVYARSLPLSTRKLRIDYAALGVQAALRGAAVLAVERALLVEVGA